MKKLLLFLLLMLISCTGDLYPTQHFNKGYRVKTTDNSKLRKRIRNHSNCGIYRKWR